jgi:hypothetical protein
MTRVLGLLLLVAACSGDSSGPKQAPQRFVVYVNGTSTGTPGPYCQVHLYSPALVNVTSHEGVTDSVASMVNVKPGRYRVSWDVDFYNSSGAYNTTLSSQPTDSGYVPGGIIFSC